MKSLKHSISCKYFLIFSLTLLCSCITISKESSITKKNIHLNMSKEEVEDKIGKPFKIESKVDDRGNNISSSYYKEPLWTGSEHITIENILIFKNDILMEIKQGREEAKRSSYHRQQPIIVQ